MSQSWALGALMLLAVPVLAERAELVVAHERGWRKSGGALAVRVGGGAWQTVQPSTSLGPLSIDGGATVIEVRPPGGGASVKRLAVLEPGLRYRLEGNPCAVWELVADSSSVEPTTVTLDLRGLPSTLFPLWVSTARGDGEAASVVEAPSLTVPFTPPLSAMCMHSGFPLRVETAKHTVLFDADVILEPAGRWVAGLVLGEKGKGVASFSRSATR